MVWVTKSTKIGQCVLFGAAIFVSSFLFDSSGLLSNEAIVALIRNLLASTLHKKYIFIIIHFVGSKIIAEKNSGKKKKEPAGKRFHANLKSLIDYRLWQEHWWWRNWCRYSNSKNDRGLEKVIFIK